MRFADKLWEFFLVLALVLSYCVFVSSFQLPSQREALDAARSVSPLDHGESGEFQLQHKDLPDFLRTLAAESNKLHPASPTYSALPARMLIGQPTNFTVQQKLKSNSHFEVNTAFSFVAWVQYRGNGHSARLLRKTRVATSGELATCWEMSVEPLRLWYRAPVDITHFDWAAYNNHEDIEVDGVSYKHDTLQGAGFHLVAMTYEYWPDKKMARVRFGLDGQPLQEASKASDYQPFPLTDCADGETLVGSADIEVADLLWIPRAISDKHFHGLYTGDLRPTTATTFPEELVSASDFMQRAEEQSLLYAQQETELMRTHLQFMYALREESEATEVAETASSDEHFRIEDAECSTSDSCDIRLFPKDAEWWRSEGAAGGYGFVYLVNKTAGELCSDPRLWPTRSWSTPKSSTRPNTVSTTLDRFSLNFSAIPPGSYMYCWKRSELHHTSAEYIGTLTLVPETSDYVEFVGMAMTLEAGHSKPVGTQSPELLTWGVESADAVTVTMFVRLEASHLGGAPILFMKTLTNLPVVSNNAVWGISLDSLGRPRWWKDVYADDGTTAPEDPLVRNSCYPQADLRDHIYHVAFVHVVSEQRGALYLDGEICAVFNVDTTSGYDPERIFADGRGNLTLAASRGGSTEHTGSEHEFTGDIAKVRYYKRELSSEEIKDLATPGQSCRSLDDLDMGDEPRWLDAAGKGCKDYAALQREFRLSYEGPLCDPITQADCPVVCGKSSNDQCPIGCAADASCHASGIRQPKVEHLFPRNSWTENPRLCLGRGLTAEAILARCDAMSLPELRPARARELWNGAPWMTSAEDVEDGSRMCRSLATALTGANTCPLDLSVLDRRWMSGEDWTLLWDGGQLQGLCTVLLDTRKMLVVEEEARLTTDVSTGSVLKASAGADFGWAAISVSKSKNQILYFRAGKSSTKPFQELEKNCPIEALMLSQVENLRLLPRFYSVARLTEMYYREQAVKKSGKQYKPLHNDVLQFAPRSKNATFKPFGGRVVDLLPAIMWNPRDSDDVVEECQPLTQAVMDIAVRRRAASFECDSATCSNDSDVLDWSCNGTRSSPRNQTEILDGTAAYLSGQQGLAFDLSTLQRAVTHAGQDLHDPVALIQELPGPLHAVFTLVAPPADVVYAVLKLRRDSAPIAGKVTFTVYTTPTDNFLASGIVTLCFAVFVIINFAGKWIIRHRRRPSIESKALCLVPMKNLGHLLPDMYCPDPVARTPIGHDFQFSTFVALLALIAVPWAIVGASRLEEVLMRPATALTGGELPMAERMAVLREIESGMLGARAVAMVCVLIGFMLAVALLSLFGFHMRTAIVIRSLKAAASPLGHFLLIFLSASGLITFFMHSAMSSVNDGYATWSDTLNSQANFFFGSRPSTDSGSPAVNIVSHTLVTVLCTFILLNVFLAIVMDSYTKEAARVEDFQFESSLVHDSWLFLRDAWALGGFCRKRWFLAHILSTTPSDAVTIDSAQAFVDLVAECPLVRTCALNCETLVYRDATHGCATFTERQLRAYFAQIRSRELLWPTSLDIDASCDEFVEDCAARAMPSSPPSPAVLTLLPEVDGSAPPAVAAAAKYRSVSFDTAREASPR